MKRLVAELVGRTKELRALGARLDGSPLTLVVGRAGIGKTSTVRQAVRDRERVVEVGVRPGDDRRQVVVAIGRALAKYTSVPLRTDLDALGEDVARAVESVAAVVVVDDLHQLAAAEARALVEQASDIARVGRWVFVARALPPPLLKARWRRLTVEIDDLDARSLSRLARALAPNAKPAEIASITEAAQGSPWLLRRCLTTHRGGPPNAEEIAAALPKRAAPLLRLLAALHLPIDASTARALGGHVPRGPEVELTGDRVRAHDALRDALVHDPVDADLPRRLDAAARRGGDVAASLEAARLHIERGDPTAASKVLERTFDAIVDAGLAPRLHTLLRATTAAELSELRLRAAIALGAGPSLDEVLADPRADGAAAQTRHAEALLLAGRLVEARALLLRLPSSLDVQILLARAHLTLGALDEAGALLATLDPADVRVRALRAGIAAARGNMAAAVTISDELGASADDLPPALRRLVQYARLGVYSSAGMLTQSTAAARSLVNGPSAGSLSEELGAIAALATGEVARGRLDEGRRLLGMLGANAERAPHLRFVRRMNTLHIHLIEGDFVAAASEAEAVVAEGRIAKWLDHERWGLVGRSIVRLLLASDVATPELLRDESVTGDDAQADFLRALRWMRALRSSTVLPDTERPTARASAAIDARVYGFIAEATEGLLGGAWEAAAESLTRAVALAEEHGYLVHALEARLLMFDVLFCARRTAAARKVAREVDAIGRSMGSRRFALEAELAEALLADRPEVAVLERVADASTVAPAAARRAKALLGLASECDRIDRAVVEATPWNGRIATVRGGVGRSWGVDLDESRVWFPDGRTRNLAGQHGALLRTLAGGARAKERLAEAVWGVRDYHRLRDDKRIQVAIMRLRRVVEDGDRPRRILSTSDGYAIGDGEPMRIIGR